MKNVLIEKDCKYAQDKPSLPILEFVEGETYPLEDYLADSIIENGDGNEAKSKTKSKTESEDESEDKVKPETKENPRKGKSKSNKGNK